LQKDIHNNKNLYTFNKEKRGKYNIERVKLFTLGAPGLFYVWTYKKTNQSFYLYPEKLSYEKNYLDSKLRNSFMGDLEFESHKKYIEGQDAQRIDWKLFAKTGQLYKKEYIFEDNSSVELNFNHFPGPPEERLKYLSYIIKKLYQHNKKWRLILPTKTIETSQGKKQFKDSMEAISVY